MDKEIIVVAHNIRSLWNVGSFFRTADAFNVAKLYLTGYTAIPPRREISKTAIGAEQWIPWEQQDDVASLLNGLKADGWNIVGLELTDDAIALSKYKPKEKTCLVLGHEVTGISEELLALCDETIMSPMLGKKESLNVSVAAGIALNGLRNHS